jgi:hypothetical protein
MSSISETTKYQRNRFNSIVASKFCHQFTFSKGIKKFNIYFIVKKKQANKSFFLYIVLTLMFNVIPTIDQSKKKKNKKHTFLGFTISLPISAVSKLIMIYLSILDIVIPLKTLALTKLVTWTWCNFPIIYEVDKLCEINSEFVDYFQDYKLIFKAVFFSGNNLENEFLIRFFKLPVMISP